MFNEGSLNDDLLENAYYLIDLFFDAKLLYKISNSSFLNKYD